ncbi:MAG: heat shock protein HslJ [Candidatus Krumholzibacteriia bacterium]
MKNLRILVLAAALVAVVALTGCTYNGQKAIADNEVKLANTYWKLIMLDGVQVNAQSTATEMHFILNADDTISGFGGCNNFSGSWEMDGDQLMIGPLMATKMACDNMEIETRFLGALDGAVAAVVDDATLTVTDGDGIELRFLALSHK